MVFLVVAYVLVTRLAIGKHGQSLKHELHKRLVLGGHVPREQHMALHSQRDRSTVYLQLSVSSGHLIEHGRLGDGHGVGVDVRLGV